MLQKRKSLLLVGVTIFAVAAVFAAFGKNRDTAGLSKGALDGKGGLESPVAPVYTADAAASAMAYKVYRVKKGDMIGPLAESFGLTQDTLISVNQIRNSRTVQIGQYLKIPPIPGILYTVRSSGETAGTVAEKYEVAPEKILEVNQIGAGASLTAGTSVFVPDAKLDWVTLQEINGDILLWPLRHYRLTSYYSWRPSPFTGARTFHNGLDMAAPTGTRIYPGLSGTVIDVGYNNTYGNYVILAHHSGYRTLYGHMSQVNVSRGDYVSPYGYANATAIGLVGSTGLSTGPHLHFTVYKNGKTVNPIYLLP